MKNLIASLFVAFIGINAAFAQQPAAVKTNPNAAVIKFDKKVIDYGTIEFKANSDREFTFTNTGKEPLILSSVRASCGCTTPSWTREPVAPGATGTIKVKYDTGRVGNFSKTITVKSNASNGTVTLKIQGKVKPKAQDQTVPSKGSTSKVSKSTAN